MAYRSLAFRISYEVYLGSSIEKKHVWATGSIMLASHVTFFIDSIVCFCVKSLLVRGSLDLPQTNLRYIDLSSAENSLRHLQKYWMTMSDSRQPLYSVFALRRLISMIVLPQISVSSSCHVRRFSRPYGTTMLRPRLMDSACC